MQTLIRFALENRLLVVVISLAMLIGGYFAYRTLQLGDSALLLCDLTLQQCVVCLQGFGLSQQYIVFCDCIVLCHCLSGADH